MGTKTHNSKPVLVSVTVVSATAHRQLLLRADVPVGTTVLQAIYCSGILISWSEIDISNQKLSIFGKIVPHTQVVSAGDRIEILWPLIVDPKQARRLRAQSVS